MRASQEVLLRLAARYLTADLYCPSLFLFLARTLCPPRSYTLAPPLLHSTMSFPPPS